MSRLNCLLAAASSMLLSFGVHAGEIYEFDSLTAVEHQTYGPVLLTGILVGGTQVVEAALPPEFQDRQQCTTQYNIMLEHPGVYTLRLDAEWDFTGSTPRQYLGKCKLQRKP